MKIFKEGEYLTEDKLYFVLRELFTEKGLKVERQFKVGKYKVDFLVGEKLVIEFDGYRHYNSTKNQLRDSNVRELCQEQNLDVMYVPYFIQYPYVCEVLGFHGRDFGYKYPNGFIDKKALRPQDFNVYGVIKFITQLNTFTEQIKQEILATLNRDDMETCHILEDYMLGADDNP